MVNREVLARHMAASVDGLSVHMAEAALQALLEGMTAALAEGKTVHLAGFGRFSPRAVPARHTWHPRTRQPICIPARIQPHFTPAASLRQALQSGREDKT
ncbi:MAG: HU family DNA-binding protein [Thermostichales cyanobacterium SZTDM-1c_bins_54]